MSPGIVGTYSYFSGCIGDVMFDPEIQTAVDQKLNCAEDARRAGNEGKARVCARRAAGIALRALFNFRGERFLDPSAYAALNHLCELETTPQAIKNTANRLLTRVAPDYTLPINTDLIADAKELIAWADEQVRGASS